MTTDLAIPAHRTRGPGTARTDLHQRLGLPGLAYPTMGVECPELMACANDRFGVVHHDTAESVALVVGADRNPFDVAGVNDNTTVVQGPGHDRGERYEGLTIDEGPCTPCTACSQSWGRKLDPNALRTNASAALSCPLSSSPGSAISTSTMDDSLA